MALSYIESRILDRVRRILSDQPLGTTIGICDNLGEYFWMWGPNAEHENGDYCDFDNSRRGYRVNEESAYSQDELLSEYDDATFFTHEDPDLEMDVEL